jgi:exosortase A-associated hydrolase 2
MTTLLAGPGAEPFFLESGQGQRFCLFHPPAVPCQGAVLYVHPFAEEMNRSRRMAALQARALAALGYGVLQIDLHGCGDSSGDFGDARWEQWRADLALGAAWLRSRLDRPPILWGLRLGALLALDYARSAADPVHALLLWQPVLNGSTYLTQFLRLRMVNALLDGGPTAQTGTDTLRRALQAGEMIEVAGYDLHPALAAALDRLSPAEAMVPACPVHWFEACSTFDHALPAARARVGASWRASGVDLHLHVLHCPPFWTTPEVTENPAWVAATSAAMQESM